YTRYSFKLSGTYNAPWGIMISPLFRFQNGAPYARTLSVSAPASCACTFSAARAGSLTNTTVYTTPYGAYRQDNFGHVAKVRLFLDGYNLTNSYAAQTINVTTGPSFQNPTSILAPRTGRIGFRFIW